MFKEGQLYSSVTTDADGEVQVHLGENHPGFTDTAYRARRAEIAGVSLAHRAGEPVPHVDYTAEEQGIWRVVSAELAPKHEKYAHSEFLEAKAALALPTDRVPQLEEVSALLRPLTGWSYTCAPGLVPLRAFYADLGARTFNSTQYLRHPSQPLYTPEPDIIHEVIGHANQLASPRFAAITEAAGQAIRPLDLHQMGTLNYDITAYQPVLFRAESLDHLEDVVGHFFATVDDDLAARLRAESSTYA